MATISHENIVSFVTKNAFALTNLFTDLNKKCFEIFLIKLRLFLFFSVIPNVDDSIGSRKLENKLIYVERFWKILVMDNLRSLVQKKNDNERAYGEDCVGRIEWNDNVQRT